MYVQITEFHQVASNPVSTLVFMASSLMALVLFLSVAVADGKANVFVEICKLFAVVILSIAAVHFYNKAYALRWKVTGYTEHARVVVGFSETKPVLNEWQEIHNPTPRYPIR